MRRIDNRPMHEHRHFRGMPDASARAVSPSYLRRIAVIIMAIMLALSLCALGGCSTEDSESEGASASSTASTSSTSSAVADAASGSGVNGVEVDEDGTYTSKDEVALYIHTYGHLPSNYITKTKARKAGWDPESNYLSDVCPGKSIGGGRFYNDDSLLPDAEGRTWTECDIDYQGGSRNAKRIVFSNDGLIYYTDDHYQTFEQLYKGVDAVAIASNDGADREVVAEASAGADREAADEVSDDARSLWRICLVTAAMEEVPDGAEAVNDAGVRTERAGFSLHRPGACVARG